MLCLLPSCKKSARGREEILLFMLAKVPSVQPRQVFFFNSLNTFVLLETSVWSVTVSCVPAVKKKAVRTNYISTFANLRVCPPPSLQAFDPWPFSRLALVPVRGREAASGAQPSLQKSSLCMCCSYVLQLQRCLCQKLIKIPPSDEESESFSLR